MVKLYEVERGSGAWVVEVGWWGGGGGDGDDVVNSAKSPSHWTHFIGREGLGKRPVNPINAPRSYSMPAGSLSDSREANNPGALASCGHSLPHSSPDGVPDVWSTDRTGRLAGGPI